MEKKVETKAMEPRVFKESLSKPTFKKDLKEASNSLGEEVRKAIKTLRTISPSVFYTALGIYEWTGEENPSDEVCKKVDKFLDDVDTIYDEWVRNEVQGIVGHDIDGESNDEEEFEEGLGVKKKSFVKLSNPKHSIAKKINK